MGMTKEAAARKMAEDPNYFRDKGKIGGRVKRVRPFDDIAFARKMALKSHGKTQEVK